jgi:hypothetical protein
MAMTVEPAVVRLLTCLRGQKKRVDLGKKKRATARNNEEKVEILNQVTWLAVRPAK